MIIEILTIFAFAALFVGFALLRPADGRSGCHGCARGEGERDCSLGCVAAERSTTSVRKGPS